MTTRLSWRLREYGIKSDKLRPHGQNQCKGYRLADLEDVWRRYLPSAVSPSAGIGFNNEPWKLVMSTSKQAQVETDVIAADRFAARRMLSEKQVLEIVPVGRTTLYRMEKAGRFPKSTYISPNRRVWFEDEIIAWQNAVDEFDPSRGRGKGRRQRVSSSPC